MTLSKLSRKVASESKIDYELKKIPSDFKIALDQKLKKFPTKTYLLHNKSISEESINEKSQNYDPASPKIHSSKRTLPRLSILAQNSPKSPKSPKTPKGNWSPNSRSSVEKSSMGKIMKRKLSQQVNMFTFKEKEKNFCEPTSPNNQTSQSQFNKSVKSFQSLAQIPQIKTGTLIPISKNHLDKEKSEGMFLYDFDKVNYYHIYFPTGNLNSVLHQFYGMKKERTETSSPKHKKKKEKGLKILEEGRLLVASLIKQVTTFQKKVIRPIEIEQDS